MVINGRIRMTLPRVRSFVNAVPRELVEKTLPFILESVEGESFEIRATGAVKGEPGSTISLGMRSMHGCIADGVSVRGSSRRWRGKRSNAKPLPDC